MNIRGDVKEITRHLSKTQRWVIPQAVPAALNKTGGKLNTQVRREISKRLGIPQKHFKNQIKLFRATRRRWEAKEWVGLDKRIPVSRVYKSKARQLTYAKGVQNVPASKLFPATMPSGHEGIFYRKGSSRLPIQEVMIDLTRVADDVLEMLGDVIVQKEFKRLLAHEIQYRINRRASR